ncbi:MAG: sulfite exporter TauE/SafE family protein, partial [Aquaticitalea sp.]
ISGPDHLAAVTPLVIESEKKAWKVGLFWGFGHLVGMMLIGVLFLIFKDDLPFEKISQYNEQFVGIILIGIGLWAFYRIFKQKKHHTHPHIHSQKESFVHIHEHHHETNVSVHQHEHAKVKKQKHVSSFGIGVIHGFAGIAHFLLLLPVLGFESTSDSVQYIAGFGIGTILAMTTYALVLGHVANYSKKEQQQTLFQGIRLAGGLFALIIGIYWTLNF